MKKVIFILIFISFNIVFSQDDEPDVVTLGDETVKENGNITIPLYNVYTDGVDIPVFLSYNTKGFKVNDVPSSVGFNWQLNAGGVVDKTINHIEDEAENGWFFTPLTPQVIGDILTSHQITQKDDLAPDIFSMHMSNGNFLKYVYYKNQNSALLYPYIYKQSENFNNKFSIFTNFNYLKQNATAGASVFYTNNDDYEISFFDKKNITYTFRRGVKQEVPWETDRYNRRSLSTRYTNYYIHKIYAKNRQIIEFKYNHGTRLNKYILLKKAVRLQYQSNSDPHTPPDYNDPIVSETSQERESILVEDVSRKEIKKIITSKETIEFTYKEGEYYTALSLYSSNPDNILPRMQSQTINLLDEIKRFDHNGNYISGYQFFYDIQNQDNPLKLTHIIKYGKNHLYNKVYKKFEYYDDNNYRRPSASTKAKDVFDYPNGISFNWNSPPILRDQFPIRFPNESKMVSGMLKSITNQNGGKTEYLYTENSFGDMYYGGLLIESIRKYDMDNLLTQKINYTYENPEGFGLPIYDNWQQNFQGDIPPNMYDFGYFEEYFQGCSTWQTYFTKVLPTLTYPCQVCFPAYAVSSIPYALMRNTIYTDAILNNLNLQNYSQIQDGSFYKKITKTIINTNTDNSENGKTIQYFRPNISGFHLDKILEKKEVFNNNGVKVMEKLSNYEDVYNNYIQAYKLDNAFSNTGYQYKVAINDYPIYMVHTILRNIETNKYTDLGDLLQNKKDEFVYLNEGGSNVDYHRIKTINKYHNNALYKKIENKYISEIENIEFFSEKELLVRHLNPVMEKDVWVKSNSNWQLESATIKDFFLDGKVKKTGTVICNIVSGLKYTNINYTPANFDTLGNLISLMNNKIEYEYDVNNKLVKFKNTETNISNIYQRSEEYNGLYIDAILTTSETQPAFLRKSFENKDEPSIIKFEKAFSGNFVFEGTNLSVGDFPTGYRISFWAYTNDNWVYNSYTHTGGDVVISKPTGADFIDELRIQPVNSTMQTYTFNPLIGETSSLNDRGDGNRIEYDSFNRPLFIFDKNHKVLQEYRYNSATINITN